MLWFLLLWNEKWEHAIDNPVKNHVVVRFFLFWNERLEHSIKNHIIRPCCGENIIAKNEEVTTCY